MQTNRTAADRHSRARGRLPVFALQVAVYWDALRADPQGWLLAAWWRLCGKRVRARAQMAPLLGRSRRAYQLWLAKGGDMRLALAAPDSAPVALFALVIGEEGADRTLTSLAAEGISAELVSRDNRVATRLTMADGWIMPLFAGDSLAEGAGAIYRAAAAAADPQTQAIYADDDLLDRSGQRCDPHFKPDWNAELFRYFDYLTGAAIVRTDGVEPAGRRERDWPAELVTRAATAGKAPPVHLQQILHHRQSRPAPLPPARLPVPAKLVEALPPVSVLIPTRNRHDLLRTCLDGLARTAYPAGLEIVVIDNGSDDPATLDYLATLDPGFARVLRDPGPFNFAALNNSAVGQTQGKLLCFLNNDIEIGEPDWLVRLAAQAVRPDVGAVGPCLLYPDGRIQHAGVVLGIGGGAAHAHRLLRPEDTGYFRRHLLPQFVAAVTGACLVVRRDRFMAVGGFDAASFAVAFNDVDLCLRLNACGWQSLYEPRAMLVHHESVSRGLDRDRTGAARLAGELAALQERWGVGGMGGAGGAGGAADPFHHPALSPFSERFVLRL